MTGPMASEPEIRRPTFTLLQLFTAVTALAVLLALGVQLIQQGREAARRTSCGNDMKQLVLAAHNYHDSMNELPPLATNPGHWSWILVVLPFYESGDTYWRLQLHRPATTAQNLAVVRKFHTLYLICPARRDTAIRSGGTFNGCQPTDYIAVSTSESLKWSPTSDGTIVYRLAPPTATSRPRSATTFKSVTDGLANTAMISEKHMRPAWLGGKWDEPAFVAIEGPNTIRVATDRLGGKGLAQRNEHDDPWVFGSWHHKVVLFAMGDGSVREVSNATDPKILRLLSCRHDGQSLELP